MNSSRICPRCQTSKELIEFYNRRGKEGNSVYCKSCTSDQTLERQRSFKLKAVEHCGGKCLCCGYDTYQGALEFHHKDPNSKDFSLSHVKLTTFNQTIIDELDKCVLVCANCHREIHAGLRKAP